VPGETVAELLPLASAGTAVASVADLASVPDGGVATCFDLPDEWLALVEGLRDAAAGRDITVILSVPNEAPWGTGAFEELLRLLPTDAVAGRAVPLRGVALTVDGAPGLPPLTGSLDGEPVELVVAFGPRASELSSAAVVEGADLADERRRRRELEAELAVLRSRVGS
jgi:hypothetical protein